MRREVPNHLSFLLTFKKGKDIGVGVLHYNVVYKEVRNLDLIGTLNETGHSIIVCVMVVSELFPTYHLERRDDWNLRVTDETLFGLNRTTSLSSYIRSKRGTAKT